MIASAYFSPPMRQPFDAAEFAYREGAAGLLVVPDCTAASSIAPAPGAPTPAVERHGADGDTAHAPSAPEHVPAHEVRLIEPDGRVWWMVGGRL